MFMNGSYIKMGLGSFANLKKTMRKPMYSRICNQFFFFILEQRFDNSQGCETNISIVKASFEIRIHLRYNRFYRYSFHNSCPQAKGLSISIFIPNEIGGNEKNNE